MKQLTVKATLRKYKVRIEDDYRDFRGFLRGVTKGEKVCLIRDENVNAEEIIKSLKGYEVSDYPLGGGENVKTASNFIALAEFLYKNGFSRADTLIALGGGSISDLTGFVASAYMRGMNYVNVPTTLLGAVDACVGGKTAVDTENGKNVLGAFYPPTAVFIAMSEINSLPEKQILCGKAEMAKYALLSGDISAEDLGGAITKELIYKCLTVKRTFVERDEFDLGARRALNLGHTVAHAYETASNFTLSHGEAVARGLYKIIDVSAKYFEYGEEKTARMMFLLSAAGFDKTYAEELPYSDISGDKKAGDGKIELVLIKDVGNVKIVKLSVKKAKELLEWK